VEYVLSPGCRECGSLEPQAEAAISGAFAADVLSGRRHGLFRKFIMSEHPHCPDHVHQELSGSLFLRGR
jgi:hypothetical protein